MVLESKASEVSKDRKSVRILAVLEPVDAKVDPLRPRFTGFLKDVSNRHRRNVERAAQRHGLKCLHFEVIAPESTAAAEAQHAAHLMQNLATDSTVSASTGKQSLKTRVSRQKRQSAPDGESGSAAGTAAGAPPGPPSPTPSISSEKAGKAEGKRVAKPLAGFGTATNARHGVQGDPATGPIEPLETASDFFIQEHS